MRPANEVMRLSRMGAAFPSRLSMARRLLRALTNANASVARTHWKIDENGYGEAVYGVTFGSRTLSLCCFSNPLGANERSDRVIASAWDAGFALYDGVPNAQVLSRLAQTVPHQEAARFEASELVLSRANRSVRAFEHVADALAKGRQPQWDIVHRVGYLMRTTAVYGNGKFGIADRSRLVDDALLRAPFQAELLSVFLIRDFTLDLVEHVAQARGGTQAVRLAPHMREAFGVGNSTGLGMAPFLVNHPDLLHRWVWARETALSRVRAVSFAQSAATQFVQTLARARAHVGQWRVDDAEQSSRIAVLDTELEHALATFTVPWLATKSQPWDAVCSAARDWSLEAQECLVSVLLEPHSALVDDLAEQMASDVVPVLDPAMSLASLGEVLHSVFGWALAIDFTQRDASARFWYVSAEKLEPRLGERYDEPGAERELPLDIARAAQALSVAVEVEDAHLSVGQFLFSHPQFRHIVRRVQYVLRAPYAEIHDNLLDSSCRPLDMLRFKLAYLGASKFDPRSDRWTRVTLFQGAPSGSALADAGLLDWSFPVFPTT
jgi:hypothetical protein